MRRKFKWDVQLQREDGELVKHRVEAFWDPTQEGTADLVANTAQAEAHVLGGKRFKYAALAAVPVADR